jgi:tetrahydromethanopterin S-methyltransferase subunit A
MENLKSETTQRFRYEITVDLSENENPDDVFEAIEELLHGMGQIGTLSMRSVPDDD